MSGRKTTEEITRREKVKEMEGMRKIARAYYARASDNEKRSMLEFFKKLDSNGDGKVTLVEFKKSVSSRLSDESLFRQLDSNGDGTLDFNEVLALYYMEEKVHIGKCVGCNDLLVGPYFSCSLCVENPNNTYDLCCACHRGGKFFHKHSSNHMLDHQSLLNLLRQRSAKASKTQAKTAMEELREIAKSHYRAGSKEVQDLAYKFFQSMDTDGDGRVDLSEFLAFMRLQGYQQMRNPYFFHELDQDGNGTLDFSEVMTLYYIIKSGRPFCDYCGKFIPGIFFTCVECFRTPEDSYNLCRDCYQSTKCKHNHNGRAQFLDNYTLLETKRDSALAQATGVRKDTTRRNDVKSPVPSNAIVNPTSSSSSTNLYINQTGPTYHAYHVINPPTQSPNYANAIVPASSTTNTWSIALKAFEVALAMEVFPAQCVLFCDMPKYCICSRYVRLDFL